MLRTLSDTIQHTIVSRDAVRAEAKGWCGVCSENYCGQDSACKQTKAYDEDEPVTLQLREEIGESGRSVARARERVGLLPAAFKPTM